MCEIQQKYRNPKGDLIFSYLRIHRPPRYLCVDEKELKKKRKKWNRIRQKSKWIEITPTCENDDDVVRVISFDANGR